MLAKNADGKIITDYQVREYTDGTKRFEVFYYADGKRFGAVDFKRVNPQTHKMETRKQLVKRLCEALGIAQ